jgi:hypothetical protein
MAVRRCSICLMESPNHSLPMHRTYANMQKRYRAIQGSVNRHPAGKHTNGTLRQRNEYKPHPSD